MKTRRNAAYGLAKLALALLAMQPLAATAQVPVDEDGKVIGAYEPALDGTDDVQALQSDAVPLMSAADLEDLVGPVALYPDDLIAIILPAAAYPQQIIDAGRFLEALEDDASLKPDPNWDDSVVALLNYPEVVELMNDDIDWTWRLGEAVIAQQTDVVAAIESFRDRAYNAGNLKSDDYQTVSRNDGHIEITPVAEDVIYVPYYEPERVVVYQPRPVYYYYPRSYPVYYYPYTSAYHFNSGYFWGVTTAFSIGWWTDSLHVYHHSYHGHPYYGRHYRDRWWYRRPTMSVYNRHYYNNTRVTVNRYYDGDRWRPRHDRHAYVRQDVRQANSRYTARRANERQAEERRRTAERQARTQTVRRQEPVVLRQRSAEQRARMDEQRSDLRRTAQQRRGGDAARRSSSQQSRDATTRQRDSRQDTTARQSERRQELVAQQRQYRQEPSRQTREPTTRQSRDSRRETPDQAQQQRRQQVTPAPAQRQQRSATPQRQQRSAPQPRQQRSAPQPRQQRSAPQ
ncbi:MAG: DUF3300 domain-containing protein, partial [Chromatiales bacterium]